ncbi:hypothetical protein AU255_01820 [Methyloprofundus sedimenti]|uniref:Uncharacterized protein n=1 Tax=Methyloprofundus sedimenti TaxID=1420851 RepID=A0A1V8M537_9GAMM|nr:hypothetical protein [Methyloprofundus sedimenti]OQK16669.1 hypothetical protein AU255_01820 [Methyloprofundus sedimenti]
MCTSNANRALINLNSTMQIAEIFILRVIPLTMLVMIVTGCQSTPIYQALFNREEVIASAKSKMKLMVDNRTNGYNEPVSLCKSNGLDYLTDDGRKEPFNIVYPISDCKSYAQSLISKANEEDLAAKLKMEAEKNEKQREEDQRRAEEAKIKKAEIAAEEAERKRQHKVLTTKLKSGKVAPKNWRQAIIAFSANDGAFLASAPKIRPDGKIYSTQGTIALGNKDDTFIAKWFPTDAQFLVMRRLGARSRSNLEPRYYKVKVPKLLRKEYYEKAKLGGMFVFVGKYVSNEDYATTNGQNKSMPVFEATYLQFI